MAAKFTSGDSIKTTRTLSSKSPPPTVRATSHVLDTGNTMSGMPGHIKAGMTASEGGARGGKGVGPKREGPIGKRGSSGAKYMGKSAPGTMTRSYRSESTGHPGRIEKMKARTSFEAKRKSSTMY